MYSATKKEAAKLHQLDGSSSQKYLAETHKMTFIT
jgi:hypothetical protein